MLIEVAFISGRPKETRLVLLKEMNTRVRLLEVGVHARKR